MPARRASPAGGPRLLPFHWLASFAISCAAAGGPPATLTEAGNAPPEADGRPAGARPRPPMAAGTGSVSVALMAIPLAGSTAQPVAAPPAPSAPVVASLCNEQPPQPFLVRGTYAWKLDDPPAERARKRELHTRAIAYRTRHYGFVEGFGESSWNRRTPSQNARDGSFFGVPVRMNAQVLVALGCVEATIRQTCGEAAYRPHVLDGLRTRNTFHGSEASNHLYGIAIDVDFDKNSCCGCVPPLSEWPRCKVPVSSPFERTEIPPCWVESFERFGFYWLGFDTLEDTMHFEFLGDPDRIVRGASDG